MTLRTRRATSPSSRARPSSRAAAPWSRPRLGFVKGVVPNQPNCRKCGAPVRPLRKCANCGRRSILAFFLPSGGRW